LVAHISAHNGSLFSASLLRTYLRCLSSKLSDLGPPAQAEGAFIYLAAGTEGTIPGELEGAERTGIEAVATADADVLSCSTTPSSVV